MTQREKIQAVFIRICRDSGFKMDAARAAVLTARTVGCHPLDVWAAMPDLDTMNRLAAGTHAAAR